MHEGNLLKRIDGLVTGDGYVREVVIPLTATVATGASAAAIQNPNLVGVVFDADNESITIPFVIPLDYDATQDELAVAITADQATGDGTAGSNAISLNVDQVNMVRPGGTGGGAIVDITTEAQASAGADQVVTAGIAQYVFDLSGLGLLPGDVVSIEIDAQEDGTASVLIWGATVRYRTCLAAYDEAQREDIARAITNA
jgi:hypothetical protein